MAFLLAGAGLLKGIGATITAQLVVTVACTAGVVSGALALSQMTGESGRNNRANRYEKGNSRGNGASRGNGGSQGSRSNTNGDGGRQNQRAKAGAGNQSGEDPDRPEDKKKPPNAHYDPIPSYLPETELTNVDTNWVLGGTYREIFNDIRGIQNRGDFEIQHFFPKWILDRLKNHSSKLFNLLKEQYCILMLKKDHQGDKQNFVIPHINTGNSRIARNFREVSLEVLVDEGVEEGFMVELQGYSSPFRVLSQYTVGIVQMLRAMLRDGAITVQEFKNILREMLEMLDRDERLLRIYQIPEGYTENTVEKLFRKIKEMIEDTINNA